MEKANEKMEEFMESMGEKFEHLAKIGDRSRKNQKSIKASTKKSSGKKLEPARVESFQENEIIWSTFLN